LEYRTYQNNHTFVKEITSAKVWLGSLQQVHPIRMDLLTSSEISRKHRLLLKTKVHFMLTKAHFSSPVHQHISCVFKTDCTQNMNICWKFQGKNSDYFI